MKIYAYARVSARDQNLDRQLKAFADFGVSGNRIYADKKSGKDFERKNYSKLLKRLRAGDLLVIKSIDRLRAQLQRDHIRMVEDREYDRRGYPRARYAPFRHADKIQHARGKVYFRHRTAGAFLCRGKRARKYPRKTSGGNRRRKKPRRAVRQAADGLLERISGNGACFQTEKHFFENCPRLHGHETGKFLLSPAPMRAA